MPGHHDNEVAAVDDKTDIRAAGNAQARPMIKKTPPATLATPVASHYTKRNTRSHGREHLS
jgi:hypothetical protein